jgi:hypothetical protein
MKVIDLLNKIANEDEIPEKIKYENYIYWYDKNWKDYKNAQVEFRSYLINSRYHNTDFLNEEVEIIEDTPSFKGFKVKDGEIIYKEDKKIEYFDDYKINARCFDELVKSINLYIELNTNKLNEIIDKINGE